MHLSLLSQMMEAIGWAPAGPPPVMCYPGYISKAVACQSQTGASKAELKRTLSKLITLSVLMESCLGRLPRCRGSGQPVPVWSLLPHTPRATSPLQQTAKVTDSLQDSCGVNVKAE